MSVSVLVLVSVWTNELLRHKLKRQANRTCRFQNAPQTDGANNSVFTEQVSAPQMPPYREKGYKPVASAAGLVFPKTARYIYILTYLRVNVCKSFKLEGFGNISLWAAAMEAQGFSLIPPHFLIAIEGPLGYNKDS